MVKFSKILSVLLSFTLIGGIYCSYEAIAIKNESKTQPKINNKAKGKIIDLIKIKDDIKSKIINGKNKVEDKLNKTKENIEKNINDNTKKVENSIKKNTEKIKKIIKGSKRENEKINEIRYDITNFNSNFIPISIKTTSPYIKAIVIDVLVNKLFNEKKLDKDMLKYDPNTLDKNYDLFSILLNKNFAPGIAISIDEKNLADLTKKVNSTEFKNFVKNIKITEEDFNNSKERINRYLEDQKQNIEKNINELKNNNNKKIDLSNLLNESKNQNEINNIIYNDGIKDFLKKYDKKLYDKIESRIKNSAFDNAFFRDSLKYSKEFLLERLNETFNKISSRDGFVKGFNDLIYSDEIRNMEIESNDIEKYDIVSNKKGRIDLFGVEETNRYFLYSPEILAYGYFNALRLNENEKRDFKEYYKKKLEETKIPNSDKKRWVIKEIVDLYFGKNSFLKKYLSKDDYEKQKNKIEKEETASKFFDAFKNFESKYYETFVNILEKTIK